MTGNVYWKGKLKMKHKTLKSLWGSLFKKEKRNESQTLGLESSTQVDSLTVGLRIDLSVPSGAGKEIAASQFVWVSPTGCDRSVRALRVLLLPN